MTTNEHDYDRIIKSMINYNSKSVYNVSLCGTTPTAIIINALAFAAKRAHDTVYAWIIGGCIIGCNWNNNQDNIKEIATKKLYNEMELSGSVFYYSYKDNTVGIAYETECNCNDMDQLFRTLRVVSNTVDDDLVFWIVDESDIRSIPTKKWNSMSISERKQDIKKYYPDGITELYYYSKNDHTIKFYQD